MRQKLNFLFAKAGGTKLHLRSEKYSTKKLAISLLDA